MDGNDKTPSQTNGHASSAMPQANMPSTSPTSGIVTENFLQRMNNVQPMEKKSAQAFFRQRNK